MFHVGLEPTAIEYHGRAPCPVPETTLCPADSLSLSLFPAPQIEKLRRELDAARSARATAGGTDGSLAKEVREKDKELRAMKKRVEELQSAIQAAQRLQRQRERDLKRVEAMQSDIEEHKKQKVRGVAAGACLGDSWGVSWGQLGRVLGR